MGEPKSIMHTPCYKKNTRNSNMELKDTHLNIDPRVCRLLNENTDSFLRERDHIDNFQKISSLMQTDSWIPRQDHLSDIHKTYLKCKQKANVKHWLNELRMVYNVCHTLVANTSLDTLIYITLFFKSYPLVFREVDCIYNWFFDVLQSLYEIQQRCNIFDASVFFEKLFTIDVNNCMKHIYLDDERNFVTIYMVRGKEIPMVSFVKQFFAVLFGESCNSLFFIHFYFNFKDKFENYTKSPIDETFIKAKNNAVKSCNLKNEKVIRNWIEAMLRQVSKKYRNNFSQIYSLFEPQLKDYLVCIPGVTQLTHFHVQYDSGAMARPQRSLDLDKLTAVDLLLKSENIQSNPDYLQILNMYIYLSTFQTHSSLVQEMKCLYYKSRPVEELKSSSDAMLRQSLEEYTSEKREFHHMVFEKWLVQKIQMINKANISLFYFAQYTLGADYKKIILEGYVLNNIPDADQRKLFKDFMNLHSYQSCFVILLNFFVCCAEYKNICVKLVPSSNQRHNGTLLGYSDSSIEIEYKNEKLTLNDNDLTVWNMLFQARDLHLNQLNAWVYKSLKNLCEHKNSFDVSKFEIPLYISKLYLDFLNENKHHFSDFLVAQIEKKVVWDNKISISEKSHSTKHIEKIAEEFIEKLKKDLDIFNSDNIQLVFNILNYIHCFIGIRQFHLNKEGNENCIHQCKTNDIDKFVFNLSLFLNPTNESIVEGIKQNKTIVELANRNKLDTVQENHLTPDELNNTNMNLSTQIENQSNTIQTKAIIEHNDSQSSRKRLLENGSREPDCTKRKKSRFESDDVNVIETVNSVNNTVQEANSRNLSKTQCTKLDNAIIIERNTLSNNKVTVFEDQFKKKLNNLNKEYSSLIDTTKIKQENEVSSSKLKPLEIDATVRRDNADVDDSSDESDVVVLGPGPPKQFDVITLNENGEEIKEGKGDESEDKSSESEDDEYIEDTSKTKENNGESTDDKLRKVDSTNDIEPIADDEEEEEIKEDEPICTYPKKWTRDMVDFYSEDINADQFRQRIQNQIYRSRPEQWRVDYHNSYRYIDNQYGYNSICENCGSRLHDVNSCPKPCFNVCPMCGETGHSPDKCPQSQCLNCGKKTDEYLFNCDECDQKVVLKIKCDICHRLYHSSDHCPHLWRSMEFTTRPGKLKVPPGGGQSRNVKYCSNCAGRGHLIEECTHLSAEHPLRQDSTWKVLSEAHAAYLIHYKLRVSPQVSKVLLSKPGMSLLQRLSNQSGVNIEYLVDEGVNLLTYKANPAQSHHIRHQLRKYLFKS